MKKSRTQLKEELHEVIDELARLPCTFWACPGQNKPVKSMCTCSKCFWVKKLRKIRDDI